MGLKCYNIETVEDQKVRTAFLKVGETKIELLEPTCPESTTVSYTHLKIADAFSNDANTKFCPVNEIPDGWEGLDIGPKTEEIFANVIKESKTILWNGPTGVFEFDNFTHGSRTAVSYTHLEGSH